MKYRTTIVFEADNSADQQDVIEFIKTELGCAGGNRHPSDPLFHSLQRVEVVAIAEVK